MSLWAEIGEGLISQRFGEWFPCQSEWKFCALISAEDADDGEAVQAKNFGNITFL